MGWIEVRRFIRTGLVPSISGGFFFNEEASEDVVLLQFYGWLALFVIPIAISLESNVIHSTRVTYSVLVGVVFLLLGALNAKLQSVLDTDAPELSPSVDLAAQSSADDLESDDGSLGPASRPAALTTPSDIFSHAPAAHAAHAASMDRDGQDGQERENVRYNPIFEVPPSLAVSPVDVDDTSSTGASISASRDGANHLPLVVRRPALHLHNLHRRMNPYVGSAGYTCDECNERGTQWGYHCGLCLYDAHPQCAGLAADLVMSGLARAESTPSAVSARPTRVIRPTSVTPITPAVTTRMVLSAPATPDMPPPPRRNYDETMQLLAGELTSLYPRARTTDLTVPRQSRNRPPLPPHADAPDFTTSDFCEPSLPRRSATRGMPQSAVHVTPGAPALPAQTTAHAGARVDEPITMTRAPAAANMSRIPPATVDTRAPGVDAAAEGIDSAMGDNVGPGADTSAPLDDNGEPRPAGEALPQMQSAPASVVCAPAVLPHQFDGMLDGCTMEKVTTEASNEELPHRARPLSDMLDGCTMEPLALEEIEAGASRGESSIALAVGSSPPQNAASSGFDLEFLSGGAPAPRRLVSQPRRVTIRLRPSSSVQDRVRDDAGLRSMLHPRRLSEPSGQSAAQRHLVESSEHHHPMYDASMMRSAWECDLCQAPQRLPNRRVVWRFRCNEGCDFDLCRRCMMMSLTPTGDGRVGQAHLHRLMARPMSQPVMLEADRDRDRTSRDASPIRRQPVAEPEQLPVANHDDTSGGSLHFFEDENGNRVYYRFADDEGGGNEGGVIANPLREPSYPPTRRRNIALEAGLLAAPQPRPPRPPRRSIRRAVQPPRLTPKRDIRMFGRFICSLSFDRLVLSHAFDHNSYPGFQVPLAAVLAALCSYVAFAVSAAVGPTATVFVWFAVGTAQYSLIKSVQPDPGTSLVNERGTSYMRSVYFILFGGIFIAINSMAPGGDTFLYGIRWRRLLSAPYTRDISLGIILFLPILWLFGHLPMWWRTFAHWSLEQVDCICFGGGGSKSLAGALTRLGMTVTAMWCCLLAAGLLSSPASISNTRMGVFQFTCIVFTFLIARWPADPRLIRNAYRLLWSKGGKGPHKALQPTAHFMAQRLMWDPFRALLYGVCFFILHLTDAIDATKVHLAPVIIGVTVTLGFARHHVIHQLGRPYPWLSLQGPLFRGDGEGRRRHARGFSIAAFIEHDVLYPLVVAYGIVLGSENLFQKFGESGGAVMLSLSSFKLLRAGYSDGTLLWLSLAIAWLAAEFDSSNIFEGILLDTFVVHTVVMKGEELLRKLGFALVYNAPGNYRAMSAFHAIMYPLQLPHAAMLVFQSVIASVFSAPLYPVAGSPLFLVSYLRPIKFFERRYTTTRLKNDGDATMYRYKVGATADNLNSIFYMELQSRLREELASDVEGGVFGDVSAGDVFLLMCNQGTMHMISMLHIIDKGNGYVSFQLRGLELAGTFCQNREAEALDLENEWLDPALHSDVFQMCSAACSRTPLSKILPLKLMRDLRWKTWEREATNYSLKKGYSISLINAHQYFPDMDNIRLFRKLMFTSAMFFCLTGGRMDEWLGDELVTAHLETIRKTNNYVEKGTYLILGQSGPMDADYRRGNRQGGISVNSFRKEYGQWISFCAEAVGYDAGDSTAEGAGEKHERFETVIRWFYGVSIVHRRLLAAFTPGMFCVDRKTRRVARTDQVRREEFFHGYHRLFEGRVDLAVAKGVWASQLPNFSDEVLVASARMALRLYQDQYADPGCFDSHEYLLETLQEYATEEAGQTVVSGETEPEWDTGLMEGTATLLSFRHNIEQTSNNDGYFVVRLIKANPENKVFRLNRESIRGLWASQQQELLYFRNIDAERGSIQNAKCVLRNIANQSCDQPVGYPIYISEIDHSFTATRGGSGLIEWVISSARSAKSWFARMSKDTPALGGRTSRQEQPAVLQQVPALSMSDPESGSVSPIDDDFEEIDLVESTPIVSSAEPPRLSVPPDVLVNMTEALRI